MEEGNVTAKRKYTPRPVCDDPTLKYRYKKKPGPKPGHSTKRKRHEPERTDAEQRRFSRASAIAKERSPEWREKQVKRLLEYSLKQKIEPDKYSRLGIPDGMTREQADAAWAAARAQAEKVYDYMVEQGIANGVTPDDFEPVEVTRLDGTKITVLVPKSDEAKAATAIKEAMVLALGPVHQQTKLAALRTVLEWTKAKPATKIDAKVNAEDWLATVTADALKDDGSKSGPA